jgi:hypothetical protein
MAGTFGAAGLCSKERDSREAAVAEGLILLGFLAVLVTIFTVRVRRRVGLASTHKTWAIVIAVFVVFVLGLWASATH